MIGADILKRLAALKLPGDAFQEVLAILAEVQGADDARRERQRERQKRSRDKVREKDVTVTPSSRENDVTSSPPDPLKKERKIPEPSGSGPSQAELERELFRRGRQVCGKSSGGLISSLLKAKQFDVSLARSVVEMAATKNDPREFVAAATRSTANGQRPDYQQRSHNLIARAKELEREAGFDEPDDATFPGFGGR